jgi:glycosyltransferase involved in cell wall biosynthesis
MPNALSVCMIVKNEERNLARCLDSVQGLGSELIVVDTGSTDETPRIAARYGAEVIPFARAVSRRRRFVAWTSRVAAVAAVVVLAGYALVLQGDLSKLRQNQDHNTSIYQVLIQKDTRTAVLTAPDGGKARGLAALRPTGHIIVNVTNLAPTQGDEAYVVWLTADNGVKSKVGWFTVSDSGDGYLEVDNVPTSASLWIWICKEQDSSVAKPSGPTIVSGTISL